MLKSIALFLVCFVTSVKSVNISCTEIGKFPTQCLYPLMGVYGIDRGVPMEFACEIYVWGLGDEKYHEGNNCTSVALEILNFPTSSVDTCKVTLDEFVYIAIHDFRRDCADHTTAPPPDRVKEEDDFFGAHSAEALWSRSAARKKIQLSKGINEPVIERHALSAASVSDIQSSSLDPVHTLWVNGPSYSQKMKTNRLSGRSWSANFGNSLNYKSLVLLSAKGHCISFGTTLLSLGMCGGYNGGTRLAYDSSTSRFLSSTGYMICAYGDPDVPASGVSLSYALQCTSPKFTMNSNGVIVHTATNLCVRPSDSASTFGSSTTNSLVLDSDCSWKFAFWKKYNRPPEISNGIFIVGAAAEVNNAGSSTVPPRWSMKLGNTDCSYNSFYDDGGKQVATNLTVTRVSDGVTFPYAINYVELYAYPSGASCYMYFRPFYVQSDGVYPATRLTKWNNFFSVGYSFRISLHNDRCEPSQSRYSGYSSLTTIAAYCEPMSDSLDDEPHLLVHSGWVGLVIDASMTDNNILPKFGSVPMEVRNGTSIQIYHALPSARLNCTLTTETGTIYTLSKATTFATISPVRQGPVVSHILATMLCWVSASDSTTVSATTSPQWWLEFSIWANSLTIQLGWEELSVGSGLCAICEFATIDMVLEIDGVLYSKTSSFTPGAQFSSGVSFTWENIVPGKSSYSADSTISVTSTGTVTTRSDFNDVIIDVPSSTAVCPYGTVCSSLPLISITLANSNSDAGVVRLTMSRNYPARTTVTQSRVGAEITGISAILRDSSGYPTGVPLQVSKKWDEVSTKQVYEAGYDTGNTGAITWWTINMFLRIPASSTITLYLGLIYNKYGGVPQFSHAQLSLTGYTDSWVWQEASLSNGGENLCFDTIGAHARAQITDVRVEFFDGYWTSNTGGSDILVYFDANGSYVYPKMLDANIWAPGPCLSNSSIIEKSADDKIAMKASINGAATDDFLKIFFHVRYDIVNTTQFSRLALFQVIADFYNYYSTFSYINYGSAATGSWPSFETLTSDCHGLNNYPNRMPYRQALEGDAPWWFSLSPQTTTATTGLGDRGIIIRSYDAVLGGVSRPQPAFSIFCDIFELSIPSEVGDTLIPGDYVEFKLELLILPQAGADFTTASTNTGSNTLAKLSSMSSSQIVATHARGHLRVVATVGAVESHYPVRVCATSSLTDNVHFRVHGYALGFVPVIICGLSTHSVVAGGGLWKRSLNATTYTLVDQSVYDDTDFWQTNFDTVTGTYERIYNIEIFNTTDFGWGENPLSPTVAPSYSPTQENPPTHDPTVAPEPTRYPTRTPTQSPTTTSKTIRERIALEARASSSWDWACAKRPNDPDCLSRTASEL